MPREEKPPPTAEEIRKFGVEPDFEKWDYDLNYCANCGQPVLIRASKDRWPGARNSISSCEYCMSKLSKRTRAARHEFIYLQGWRPE